MRILKKEIMESEDEALAYDLVVSKYLDIVHAGFAETVVNMSPPEGRFLDVGTGSGWDAILVARNNSKVQVTAVDLSDAMLEIASRNAQSAGVQGKINFIKADAKKLPFEDGIFDAVFTHNMLHHQAEPEKMVSEMIRVAKADGAIIIRDLVRHSSLINDFCVNFLGSNYDKMMKTEYRRSILAALSQKEWIELKKKTNMLDSRFTKQFITHVSIERPSIRRKDIYLKVVSPFYRRLAASFYISKP